YYLEKKKQRDAAAQAAWTDSLKMAPLQPEPNPAVKSKRTGKLSFKDKRELEGMEAAILAAETRVRELEATLNDPEFHATRSREAHTLIAGLEVARAEVTRLYDRWHELSS